MLCISHFSPRSPLKRQRERKKKKKRASGSNRIHHYNRKRKGDDNTLCPVRSPTRAVERGKERRKGELDGTRSRPLRNFGKKGGKAEIEYCDTSRSTTCRTREKGGKGGGGGARNGVLFPVNRCFNPVEKKRRRAFPSTSCEKKKKKREKAVLACLPVGRKNLLCRVRTKRKEKDERIEALNRHFLPKRGEKEIVPGYFTFSPGKGEEKKRTERFV